jgi:hypothetical protein
VLAYAQSGSKAAWAFALSLAQNLYTNEPEIYSKIYWNFEV